MADLNIGVCARCGKLLDLVTENGIQVLPSHVGMESPCLASGLEPAEGADATK